MDKKKRGPKPNENRDEVRLNRIEFVVNKSELDVLKERAKTMKKSMGKVIREGLNLT